VGGRHVGGLVGNGGGGVYLSYWDMETSGQRRSAGGRGKTTAQMNRIQTFRGWGYDMQWVLEETHDYPQLVWTGALGKPVVDTPEVYGGGTGQNHDPYLIRTPEQFVAIGWCREDFDKCFALAADIDLGSMDPNRFVPIGIKEIPFVGVFDGNEHTIRNLRCLCADEPVVGVFGYLGRLERGTGTRSGTVKSLLLREMEVSGSWGVGGLAGYNDGTVLSCCAIGTVTGGDYVGGLIGVNNGIVSCCYSQVVAKGRFFIGGLVGANGGTIDQCYSASPVAGLTDLGGLVASGHGVHRSFWDTEISGAIASKGGIGLPSSRMMLTQTFSDAGWDFNDVWTICEGKDYPKLKWENVACPK
jgi:trimeric autotransporter adhesin